MCWCFFFLTDRSKRVVVRCSLPLMLHWRNKKDVHSRTHTGLYIFLPGASGANTPKWVMYLLRVFCARNKRCSLFSSRACSLYKAVVRQKDEKRCVAERVASLYCEVTPRAVFIVALGGPITSMFAFASISLHRTRFHMPVFCLLSDFEG